MEAYRKKFDDGFARAWHRDLTREPDQIKRDIEKQQKIQDTAIHDAMAQTIDARRRMKLPLVRPFVNLANPSDIRPAFEKQEERYNAAAAELAKLEVELAKSEELRA